MKERLKYLCLFILMSLFAFAPAHTGADDNNTGAAPESLDCRPDIYPDYTGLVIPSNICPLNFVIREKALAYQLTIQSQQGNPIRIMSRSPKITIPPGRWRSLLEKNRGRELLIHISIQTEDGKLIQFMPISNAIASEEIDPFLVYRKMHPTHYYLSLIHI